jgi:hypothetical protein
MAAVVEFRDLTVEYRGRDRGQGSTGAVDGLNLSARDGEFFGLLEQLFLRVASEESLS